MSETVKPCPWCPTLPEWRRDGLDGSPLIRCELHTVWMSLDRWNRRATPDGAKGPCRCGSPRDPCRSFDGGDSRFAFCLNCSHSEPCHSARKEE
jgi:hypothetical protein